MIHQSLNCCCQNAGREPMRQQRQRSSQVLRQSWTSSRSASMRRWPCTLQICSHPTQLYGPCRCYSNAASSCRPSWRRALRTLNSSKNPRHALASLAHGRLITEILPILSSLACQMVASAEFGHQLQGSASRNVAGMGDHEEAMGSECE